MFICDFLFCWHSFADQGFNFTEKVLRNSQKGWNELILLLKRVNLVTLANARALILLCFHSLIKHFIH